MKLYRVATALLLCLLAGSASRVDAQKKPSPIKLEDPELYFAFFRSHSAVDQQIQASGPAAASQLSASTANLYGISVNDLPNLTAQVRILMANVAAWQAQEQAYLAQQKAAKKLPDMKVLVNYQRQRQRMVMNAHTAVHGSLSATSWTGLYGYINGSFKAGTAHTAGVAK